MKMLISLFASLVIAIFLANAPTGVLAAQDVPETSVSKAPVTSGMPARDRNKITTFERDGKVWVQNLDTQRKAVIYVEFRHPDSTTWNQRTPGYHVTADNEVMTSVDVMTSDRKRTRYRIDYQRSHFR